MRKLWIVILISTLLSHSYSYADVVVGVWNIENLSPSKKRGFPELKGGNQHGPRPKSALKKIADHISNDLEADALVKCHA